MHERQAYEFGEPPVSSWRSRHRNRWRTQCSGRSMDPYIMVTLDRMPTACAVRWASNHSSVLILSGHSSARTSSSRISAAVPGTSADPPRGLGGGIQPVVLPVVWHLR
ncbi:MAG: hypothetical protein CM1200mP26_11950 [Acidimicrobiales bacterium]|nr:MAG: hypothetical protein CM1200mP26_11950 [Acidimicrobiales bacterium]